MAELQVEPSGENPNKRKYAIHECVRENQESYNKKMKKSRNKVEDFKIDEFVSIKIDKVAKLHHYIQMYCLEKLQKLMTTMLK